MRLLQDWKRTILSFNRNVKFFLLANIFLQIGLGVFMVMYNLYIRELGMPETVNGKVISMTALATAVMLVPAGFLSDKFGRKWMITGGAAITVLTLFWRSTAVLEEPIVFVSLLTGIFMAFVQVSGIPFLAENSSPSERVKLFSIQFALITVSQVIGSLSGGLLADALEKFFNMGAVEAIRWSLYIGAGIFALGLPPLFALRDKPPIPVQVRETAPGIGREPIEEPTGTGFKKNFILILHFSFVGLLVGIGSGLVVPYLNLYFANRFSASNSYIGLILSLGSAMTAVAALIGPVLVKKVGKVKALILFQLLSIPFLLLTAFTNSLLFASLGFLMRQALMNAGNPIQSAVAMELVADKYRGLANSMNQTVFQLGWASMAPIATGLVVAQGFYWGYAIAFSITAGLYVVSSIYYYVVIGKKKLSED
ncbi:MFS transporter [Sporosarcina aquimarina]|uniref:MFS transporter n=1 Tax=Sporosarcina aquimarina TaxID=114975 RepID=A0ABU4G262_9BACL|nr:MFS transporter [Sporosarcina aquimarina]MDW0111064.1 MFS transporter [Sporosarcina aquimarina]